MRRYSTNDQYRRMLKFEYMVMECVEYGTTLLHCLRRTCITAVVVTSYYFEQDWQRVTSYG